MVGNRHWSAVLFLSAVWLSGCFGSGGTSSCEPSPGSVAMSLEDRYVLGANTTLRVSGLENPGVVSSDPEVVHVGPILVDHVTLEFVGIGTALITVSDGSGSAAVHVEVAELEQFEIMLIAWLTDADPHVPLAGKAVINPSFEVVYSDQFGRLYGGGLAETSWERFATGDSFRHLSLEPGLHQVEVRVGDRVSVTTFAAIAQDDIIALEILETDVGDGRIRVDAVALTEAGTQVWNIAPFFEVGDDYYYNSFEYVFDPAAESSVVVADSVVLSGRDAPDPARKEIQRAPPPDNEKSLGAFPNGRRGPVPAMLSLLLMIVAIQMTRCRPRGDGTLTP